MLFKPGTEIYWRFGPYHFSHVASASVVIRKESRSANMYPELECDSLFVFFWGLATDGEKLGRDEGNIQIKKFDGERPVTSLPTYPCDIADREDGGATRRSLIARGKRTFEVMKKMPVQLWHDGESIPKTFSSFSLMSRKFCIVQSHADFPSYIGQ